MNLSEFIIVTTKENEIGYTDTKPRIVCHDGFSISVQAGKGMYSNPRKTAIEYTELELGYPSEVEELIIKHSDIFPNYSKEEGDDYTKTIYPYTPIETVKAVIEKHGGINVEKTFTK